MSTANYHTSPFHSAALRLHGAFADAPLPYLKAWGMLLRRLPDGGLKNRLVNTLRSYPWIPLELPPRSVHLTPEHRIVMYPHTGEYDFQAHVSGHMDYEAGSFKWLAGRHYDTIIEIGANVGVYSCWFAKAFPRARIFAFEPSRLAYSRLLRNLTVNRAANVEAFCLAVSDQSGFATFFEPDQHLTNGSLVASVAEHFSEQVFRSLVPTFGPELLAELLPPDGRTLLKIDIEGAEPFVLVALERLLCGRRPDLLIEVLDTTDAALNQVSYLREVYQVHRIGRDGELNRLDRFGVPSGAGYEDNVLLSII